MNVQAAGRSVGVSASQGAIRTQTLALEGQGATEPLLRVCCISPLGYGLYRPESGKPFGGAEVQQYLLANELAKRERRQVVVLTTVDQNQGMEVQGLVMLVRRRGLHRLEGAPGLFRRLWGYGQAFCDMYRQMKTIDADVYLHSGSGVEVGAYALICRLLRKRFIYVVASSADLDEPYGNVRGPLRWLYPFGLRLADAIVCRTEEQRGTLRDRYRRDSRLIRTGHPVPEAPSDRAGAGSILWVGRAHPLKQPELFLDLAERMPQERFVMVVMPDQAHTSLTQALRRRAVGLPQVTFHEGVAWEQSERLFAEAKLFVNTSTYEGFPNTFVQAAMHRVPILSWLVNPDAVLTTQRIGACAEGSFERLVEATQRLAGCDELRRETGERARRYAEDHHDLARTAEAFDALLKQVVGRREAS